MLNANDTELREKLATIEHERWSSWQRWMHTKGHYVEIPDFPGGYSSEYLAFPVAYINHLNRQIDTPYAELSDTEKASDMEQVDRYWPLIERYAQRKVLESKIEELEKITKIIYKFLPTPRRKDGLADVYTHVLLRYKVLQKELEAL